MSDSGATLTITDASFAELVLHGTGPVLVDFWAPWCEPCKKLSPIIDDIAREWRDKITVAKLDVDANPDAAKNWHVMSLPTMIVFLDGHVVRRIVGVKTASTIREDLVALLS